MDSSRAGDMTLKPQVWRHVGVAAAAAGLGIALTACGGGSAVGAPASGRDIYLQQCAVCHGTEGEGAAGTRLSGGAVVARFPRVEDEGAVVRDGINAMPRFSGTLTAEQISAVVAYTRDL